MSGSGAMLFRGLVAESLGIALWQADGSGPEPAATGHRFDTPIGPINAHYYIASREYIDATARGAVAATGLEGDWPRLRAALAPAGLAPGDLVLRVPLTTTGADREGVDWFFKDDVETRYLQPHAPLPLLCDGAPLIEFAPTRLVLTEDYRGARTFADVRIALASEPTRAQPAGGASGRYGDIAEALLADLAGRAVRFVVDAIRLTDQTFGGQGRLNGCYAEVPAARIEIVQLPAASG